MKIVEIPKSKNIDKVALKFFIEDVRKKITSKIEKNTYTDKIDIKLRVTVLKDGNYEGLTFC